LVGSGGEAARLRLLMVVFLVHVVGERRLAARLYLAGLLQTRPDQTRRDRPTDL